MVGEEVVAWTVEDVVEVEEEACIRLTIHVGLVSKIPAMVYGLTANHFRYRSSTIYFIMCQDFSVYNILSSYILYLGKEQAV